MHPTPSGLMAALVTRLADHLLIRQVVRRTGRSRTSLLTRAGRPGGALTARHRAWADSMSLKAIPTPAARGPRPLVTPVRSRTLANDDAIGLVALTAAALFGAEFGQARTDVPAVSVRQVAASRRQTLPLSRRYDASRQDR